MNADVFCKVRDADSEPIELVRQLLAGLYLWLQPIKCQVSLMLAFSRSRRKQSLSLSDIYKRIYLLWGPVFCTKCQYLPQSVETLFRLRWHLLL